MRFRRCFVGAIAFSVAFTVSAATRAEAQTDTTRQDTTGVRSTTRIPVQKDRGFAYTNQTRRRESTGEVLMSADRMRLDSLALAVEAERARYDSLSAATTAGMSELTSKTDALATSVAAVADSLRTVRGDLSTVRGELTTVTTRANVLADSVRILDQRLYRLRNGSIFGNSGFYAGVGTGANLTLGTLDDIGYKEGLNVVVPIGFHRRGTTLGVRGEFGVQTFDGRNFGGFRNPDPKIFSAVGMLTAHLPFNQAKTHNFYLMGGGGAYMFRDVGGGSSIREFLGRDNTAGSESNVTKWGVTGGAGLEFHILGAANLFVESRFTNVFGDEPATGVGGVTGKNLRWVPITAGFTFR
jgi:hypothetical protein